MSDLKNYTTLCSKKTLQSNKKGFFLEFVDSIIEAIGKRWIFNVFGCLKTDRERMHILYHDPIVKEALVATLSYVREIYRKKNVEVSLQRRIDAQRACRRSETAKALQLLSQAVLRAPATGSAINLDCALTLCQGFWERSEVLMRMQRYNFALQDLQAALKENLPNQYKAEAFWRMAICYRALKQDKKVTVSRNLVTNLLNNNDNVIERLDESLQKQYSNAKYVDLRRLEYHMTEHFELKGASYKVALKCEEGKGRYIVANEDFSAGELIIQENAYASCLLSDFFGTHCHHCYVRLEAPVGCTDCCSVAFCGPYCRDAALRTYHRFECRFLDLLIGSGMSILAFVALRMVTQRPLQYVLDRHTEMQRGTPRLVYNLCTLKECRSPEDFFQRSVMASFLLKCLQHSGYFGDDVDNDIPTPNQLKVGEILLYNLQMLQFNSHEIYETRLTKNHRFQGAVTNYIAVAVYSSAAMFNHSCTPSVTRHFVGKYIVLRAARPIRSGQEINDSYGPNYSRKTLLERQKYLKARYLFDCKCIACMQNWPTIDQLDQVGVRIRCPNNTGIDNANIATGIQCDYLFSLPLRAEKGKCPRCKSIVHLARALEQYNKSEELYAQALSCLDRSQVEEGILLCCQGLDTFYNIAVPPHKTTQLAEECLRALYADSGNVWDIPTLPPTQLIREDPMPDTSIPEAANPPAGTDTPPSYAATVRKPPVAGPSQAGTSAPVQRALRPPFRGPSKGKKKSKMRAIAANLFFFRGQEDYYYKALAFCITAVLYMFLHFWLK